MILPVPIATRPARLEGSDYARKGRGQASIFGIENRAIVPKPSAGLHAWATPASQATRGNERVLDREAVLVHEKLRRFLRDELEGSGIVGRRRVRYPTVVEARSPARLHACPYRRNPTVGSVSSVLDCREGSGSEARAPGATIRVQTMEPHQLTTLPGGERVITERIKGVRSAAIGLWIGAGSRDEHVDKAGVSHFIEHLLFKGTERYDAVRIAELFDAMGGELNAATSRETTVVYTRVPDDHVDVALDVMTDMVFSPALIDIDSEREVVLEEIAMVEDNPQDLVHDLAAEAVFGDHPLGRPVIGSADVIASISRESLLAYHRGGYIGPNVVLAAAGNVDHKRIAEALAARRNGARQRRSRVPASRPSRTPCLLSASGARTPSSTTSASPARASGVTIRAAMRRRCSTRSSAGSASSRLFQEIREKRGMAYSVYTYGSQYVDAGQIGIYVGTREENLRECLDVIAAELQDVGAGNIRDGRARAREGEHEGTPAALARVDVGANDPARQGDRDRDGDRPDRGDRATDRAVTAEDVAALARELFAPERLSAAGIGPSEKRFRAAVQRVNPTRRAACRMKILLFGREGKVGAVLMPALRGAGHEVDGRRGRRAGRRRRASMRPSTSRPRGGLRQCDAALSAPAFRA